MKWTKDQLDLFFAMKEEGCSIEEICNALGCERQAVYDKTKSLIKMNGGRMPKYNRKSKDKSNDKGDKAMSKYPEKTATAPAAEVWRMFDEGKTRKQIAEHFGVSLQTICNRITAGRPKGLEPKAVQSEIVPETTESVTETSENVTEIAVDVSEAAVRTVEDAYPKKYEGIATASEGVEEPSPVQTEDVAQVHIDGAEGVCSSDQPKPDLLMLAIRAASMASSAGFVPDHMELDSQAARDFMRVSGVGASGKVYEIELSVTDPTRLCV